MINTIGNRLGKIAALGAMLSMAMFLFASPARADIDPVGCTDNGGGISIAAFRADGVTNIGAGTVSDGEAINYKATLTALGSPNCAFQGGTWTLTTPDGVVHNITPGGGIPRIGGTGVASLTSALVPYTVNHANEIVGSTRHIDAVTNYGGGISHANLSDSTSGPQLQSSKVLTVVHTPAVSTDIHNENHVTVTSVPAGTTVHDSATVTGETGGPAPTGTVTFTQYTDAVCQAGGAPAGTVALVAGVAHPSLATTTAGGGSISYKAHYNGDTNYAVADGPCEPLTVNKLDSRTVTDIHDAAHVVITSTSAGTMIHDKATVSGSGPTPTGNVSFQLYSDATCQAVSGVPQVVALAGGVAETTAISATAPAMSFLATYSGDSAYNGSSGICEPLTVVSRGHIIVDKVTNPAGDPTSFNFVTTGTGYGSFSLTDQATPNDQTLDAGSYSVAETPVAGWNTSAVCMDGNTQVNPASINLQAGHTVMCTFTNTKATQWCSHGYWKQSQHFDSWVGYSPNQTFLSVFGENAFPGKTLLQVLKQGGGGLNALGRDTVGELLNTAAGLNTGWTTAGIISAFDNVYPGTNAQYNTLHSQFVSPESCPLN